jgi:hypothetical protein
MSVIDMVHVGIEGTMTEVEELPAPRRQLASGSAVGNAYPNFLATTDVYDLNDSDLWGNHSCGR